MNKVVSEQELLERIAGLPREIAPETDVWPSISSRIGAAGDSGKIQPIGQTRKWRSFAVAAGFLVAFGTGLMLGPAWLGDSSEPINQPALVDQRPGEPGFAPGLSVTLAATEVEYQAAFREFMAVGDASNSLAPATVETLVLSWAEMRQSEAGLAQALQNNPDNAFLSTRMIELRARQLQFLKQIAALDHNSRRTNI